MSARRPRRFRRFLGRWVRLYVEDQRRKRERELVDAQRRARRR